MSHRSDRGRREEGDAGAAGSRGPAASPPRPDSAARWWATGLLAAASVVLALLLWQARAELQRPRPVTVVPLTPAGSSPVQGVAPPDRRVVRPPPGHRVVVLLAYAGAGAGGRFAAEVYPPTGEGPARLVEVTPRSDEALAVDLGTDPRPGRYRIVLHRLEGADGGEPRELATYGLRIGVAQPEEPDP